MKAVGSKEQKQVEQLKNQFMQRLKSQGYTVDDGVTITGKSGAEHFFALLAHKDDGLIAYNIAIGIVSAGDELVTLADVFSFDNKCYDCGLQDKVLIALPDLDHIASQFAHSQRINVLSKEKLEAFLASPLPGRARKSVPASFNTKHEVSKALGALGYKVEENAEVKGRSGSEYTFDIMAELDEGFIVHKLGMDVLSDDVVSLSQVSLFDTKAYDAGVRNKLLLAPGEIMVEARKFAQQQRIKIIKLGSQPAKPPVSEKVPVEAAAERKAAQKPVAPEDTSAGKGIPVLQDAVEELLTQAPEIKPLQRQPQPEALQLIPEAMARRFKAIPVAIVDNALHMVMANPADIFALEALALQSRMRIEPIAASEKEVLEAIDFNYKSFGRIEESISRIPTAGAETEEADLIEATADAPIASALRLIIDEAVKSRASDIHIEPQEDKLRIRYRIDGALQDVMSLPLKIHPALTSRIKIMADMNIADRLRPQDGQFSTEAKGRVIDVRVATSPTVHDETTVLRLLDKSLAVMDLPDLGFSPEALARYEDMLKVPFGMILISGPTGAGKTTTLYASVNTLDKISRNIITVEDPVEYHFDGMNQIQVNPKAGLTFATGLRSILRLDPDVILVGEIRDAETARIAIQSALTGHLVLSSIHANDAIGVIFRLLDLGIDPFLVSSAVIGVVAQRMVRRVCPNCCVSKEAPLMEQLAYTQATGEERTSFLYGEGCQRCAHSGYRGRLGLFEILPVSDQIRMQILKGASTAEIREQALEEGMVPLLKDGMLKVKEGITTPAEVLRNAYFIE
ncbi:MAG: GspE/PulE family protein [Chloroflexota bacterium]|nr:GspE/PulE family protein [Chloroflexota bacterium]